MSTNIKFPLNIQILNISSNLSRLSEWVADDYENKKPLIIRFLDQTKSYLDDLHNNQSTSKNFRPTLNLFTKKFEELEKMPVSNQDRYQWAEKALTWANILQHRAKLA